MVFRDSFADLCGGEVLYNEMTALIRLLLCVEQLHAERLLEAGIYTRRCIGSPPVGFYGPLPKQCSLALKNTRTTSDHLSSQAVIWRGCNHGVLINFPYLRMLSCRTATALRLFSLLCASYDVKEREMRYGRASVRSECCDCKSLTLQGQLYKTEQTPKS